jgi:hypothetical protein
VTSVVNDMVWLTFCYFTASLQCGVGERGGVGQSLPSSPHIISLPGLGGESGGGGCVLSPCTVVTGSALLYENPGLRIRITLMRIRIQLFIFNADPDPAFHFKADLDPDPPPHQSDGNLRPLV